MQPDNIELLPSKPYKLPLIWKRIILIFVLFFTALGGFAWYINLHWRPFLTRQIQDAISTSTDSLYHISFKEISVNILTGSAKLKDISFNPDTQVYNKLILLGKAPKHLFRVEVSDLMLNRVSPWKVYFHKALVLKSIVIEKPVLEMIYQKSGISQDTVMDNRNAYQRFSKYLKSIQVESIILQDADFKYIDKSALSNQVTAIKNLNFRISGLMIDSASQNDKTKLYYTRDISVSLSDYSYRSPNGMYDLKLKEFTASTAGKYAKINGFMVTPRYGPMEFSRKLKERKERYSVRLDEVLLENINYRMFNSQRKLKASKLSISNGVASVFLNTELLDNKDARVKKLPQKALQDFNLNTHIDSVAINNVQVSYSEYNTESLRMGTIYFNGINGNLLNVTNDSAALKMNHFCKANLTCLLMARGRLNLNVNFDLTDKNSAFSYSGELGLLKVSVLNPAIKPLALVEIRSGIVKDMLFDGKGDIFGNKGKVAVRYTHLKVKLLQKNKKDSRLTKMNIATMAANIMILDGENPSPGKKMRIGYYHFKRPANASFFNMLWRGLFIGIKESVGLDEATQLKIAAKLREMKIEKAKREVRREEKMKRKEERKSRR